MNGRRGFIGTIGAFLGFGIAAKSAVPGKVESADSRNLADAREVLHGYDDLVDQLRVQLAGCGVAATGWNDDPATPDMWGWSPSYQDVLDLRRKFEAAIRIISERSPMSQVVMLYPCGCSAVVGEDDNNALPKYCDEHGDSEHTDRCHVIRPVFRKYPTISELEEILAQEGNGPTVRISSDGQVWA